MPTRQTKLTCGVGVLLFLIAASVSGQGVLEASWPGDVPVHSSPARTANDTSSCAFK